MPIVPNKKQKPMLHSHALFKYTATNLPLVQCPLLAVRGWYKDTNSTKNAETVYMVSGVERKYLIDNLLKLIE